jgi:hypothetical protein
MDRRLSDTPEDEAAQERQPKQARARKSDSGASSGATKPNARRKASGAAEGSAAKPVAKPEAKRVAKKPRANSAKRRERVPEDAFAGLAAQGFSEGEAARLLEVSARAAYSTEARESEAVMNRLRFTRWLIERGVINEFAV